MSKYQIESRMDNGEWFSIIYNTETGKYFAGYDFMGSIDWQMYGEDAYLMDSAEAYQILCDLEAADKPAEPEIPEKRTYKVWAKRWSDSEKKQIMFLVGEFNAYFHAELFAKAYNEYFKSSTKIVEYAMK